MFSVLHELWRTVYLFMEAGVLITGDSCTAAMGGHTPDILAVTEAMIACGGSLQASQVSVQAELCSRLFTLYPKISVIPSYTAAFIAKMVCLLSPRKSFCVR